MDFDLTHAVGAQVIETGLSSALALDLVFPFASRLSAEYRPIDFGFCARPAQRKW